MKFHLYQVAIAIISGVMIYKGLENFAKGKKGQTLLKLSVRIIVWGGMALIAIFPKITNLMADLVGLEGNINAAILIGFIFVFLMMFKLLSAIERLEQDVSVITRNDALNSVTEIADEK